MSNADTDVAETPWPAPGPGMWEVDTAHFDPTVSRLTRDLMEETFERGLADGMEMVGGPLRTIRCRFVNGHMFSSMIPLVGGGRDLPVPPKPVLWLVTRLHPEFRRRAKRSITAVDGRFWMAEFERWEAEWKPRLIEDNLRLGEVQLSDLDDEQLADHLDVMQTHLRWAATLHFRLHVSDLAPIGLLLLRTGELGLDERAAMATLAGASPATSAPARSLNEIAAELDRAGLVPESLDDIRAAGGTAAELLENHLAVFGNRLTTGYDVRNRTLNEMPEAVLSSIRHADGDVDVAEAAEGRGDAALDALLATCAPEHRDEITRLVDDARVLYGLRDENGPMTIEWPAGIARRAVLETARRAVAAGKILESEHIFDATLDEMAGLLRGASSPTPTVLADRCRQRFEWPRLEAPDVLGRVVEPPEITILPGRMPLMMRAVLTVTELLERDEHDTPGSQLSGTGVGAETYRGIARVVADADDAFERAESGDIIVTRLTVPTFNSILAMAGGVVTEGGGLLSHTAVIARELGIPAVVGVHGALTEIPDGAEIELDPVLGTVTVLETHAQ